MTMFTGLYPSTHKVHFIYKGNKTEIIPLNGQWVTLPQLFKDTGYQTASWNGGGQVAGEAGFSRGFDELHENMGTITDKKMLYIKKWFSRHSKNPCFIFIHTYQIHDPYTPPRPYNEMFDPDYKGWIIGDKDKLRNLASGLSTGDSEWFALNKIFWQKEGGKIDPDKFSSRDVYHLNALYDGAILYADNVLQDFFTSITREGIMNNTIVVLTSDHGEEFKEHGGFLHKDLYRETLWVPFVIFGPGYVPQGKVIESQVRLIDLPSTVLELAGIQVPKQFLGKSLVPLIMGEENGEDLPAYSEEPWSHSTIHRSLRTDSYMLYDKEKAGKELYDSKTDLSESTDISGIKTEILSTMEEKLNKVSKNIMSWRYQSGPMGNQLSPERIEELRSLGYIE